MTTAIALVAKKLKLQPINYTLRNLAKDKGMSFEEIHEKAKKDKRFDYEIDKREILAARKDDVIIGSRLTIWLDQPEMYKKLGFAKGPEFDLKVWLTAPIEERARRISQRDKKPFKQLLAYTKKRDAMNNARFKKLYGIDFDKHEDLVDLVIDNKRFTAEHTANLIVSAAQQLSRRN
jgi:cytidylate kinase